MLPARRDRGGTPARRGDGLGRPVSGDLARPAPLVAGAVVGTGVAVAGLPLVAAAGVAGVCWIAVAALGRALRKARAQIAGAAPRRGPAPGRVASAYALPEPWRGFVLRADAAARKFAGVADGLAPGPLQVELATIAERVRDGAGDCADLAAQGARLRAAAAEIDVLEVRRRLALLAGAGGAPEETASALRAQLAAAERIEARAGQVRDELDLLVTRLETAVAQGIEVATSQVDAASTNGPAGTVGADIEAIVRDLGALRAGLADADDDAPPRG